MPEDMPANKLLFLTIEVLDEAISKGRRVSFTYNVRVKVNEQAMIFWALQYGQHIDVLEPANLREKVKTAAMEIAGKYV